MEQLKTDPVPLGTSHIPSHVAFHLWIDFLNITYVLDYKTS